MTVDAMRAAVIAIRAGVFDDTGLVDTGSPDTAVPGDAPRPRGKAMPWTGCEAVGRAVVVLAGHVGAGASTVALAIADALAAHRPVQLVDYADPARSGLAAASSIELGADGAGWRRGRRGHLDIARLAQAPPADGALPAPPCTGETDRLLVVDVARPLTSTLPVAGQERVTRGQEVVVVTRVTVPAVRQTERLLAGLSAEVLIAAVGPRRWPRAVVASCGPKLRRLRADGRVVPVPVDRRLEISGPTVDPLPKSVSAAGRALAALLVPSGQLRGPRHAASSSTAGPEAPR